MGLVDEPAATFIVDPGTSLEIYPLAPGETLADPHQNRTWPGPGIAVLIQHRDATELRYFGVSDDGLWRFLRKALAVAQRKLTAEEHQNLLKALGSGIQPE